jgi:hypothetical protein
MLDNENENLDNMVTLEKKMMEDPFPYLKNKNQAKSDGVESTIIEDDEYSDDFSLPSIKKPPSSNLCFFLFLIWDFVVTGSQLSTGRYNKRGTKKNPATLGVPGMAASRSVSQASLMGRKHHYELPPSSPAPTKGRKPFAPKTTTNRAAPKIVFNK